MIIYIENEKVRLLIPAPGVTKDQLINDVPAGLQWFEIDDNTIPSSRVFRDAWRFDGEKIYIDMPLAKDIHMSNIRKARNKKFQEIGFPVRLDTDLEAAIIPENKRMILEKLRNIPETVDLNVNTPEELQAIWPEELK